MRRLACALALLALGGCACIRPLAHDPEAVPSWDCGDPSGSAAATSGFGSIPAVAESPGDEGQGSSSSSSSSGATGGGSTAGGPSSP
jgi:hypothetical protein